MIEQYGMEVIIPSSEERMEVHRIIYEELVHGVIKDASQKIYTAIIKNM